MASGLAVAGPGIDSKEAGMNKPADLVERLNDLEAYVAHQEATIQDLSKMTLEQWDKIHLLDDSLARLKAKLEALEDSAAPPARE
jgi:uncharacterized coiled-coil protein SlyX